MSQSIRIHVHPKPSHGDYDYHLPFYGVVYNKILYREDVKKLVGLDDSIVLTSNGEPDQRLVLAKNELSQEFTNVTIQNHTTQYSDQDQLFLNRLFIKLPKPSRDFQSIVECYLNGYKNIPFVQNGAITSFRGFAKHSDSFWYHYGRDMPRIDNESYHALNQMLEPVLKDLTHILQAQLNRTGLEFDVEQNLVLRINHNEPNSGPTKDFFVYPHLDTSIFTIWIWASCAGAMIYRDQSRYAPVEVKKLHDQNNEYLVIPGLDYCDFSQSLTPATWHGVANNTESGQHRVSIVAFLKQPE